MGNKSSKKKSKDIKIYDFSKVDIPKEYVLIKIATFNINLKNGINLIMRVKDIISYIISSFKNKEIDIICIQGIQDYVSLEVLISELKRFAKFNRETFYYAPEFDNINENINQLRFQVLHEKTIEEMLRYELIKFKPHRFLVVPSSLSCVG